MTQDLHTTVQQIRHNLARMLLTLRRMKRGARHG